MWDTKLIRSVFASPPAIDVLSCRLACDCANAFAIGRLDLATLGGTRRLKSVARRLDWRVPPAPRATMAMESRPVTP